MQNGNVDDGNMSSSVSSLHSNHDSAYSSHNGSVSHVSNRSISYTPSYMNAKIPVRKPVGAAAKNNALRVSSGAPTSTQSADRSSYTPPTPAPKGTMLLAIAALPHTSTVFYVHSMLKQRPYKQIVILGNADYTEELKQLKMNIYALLGRMGREVSVQMDLSSALNEADIYTSVSRAVGDGEPICGLLCTPSYSSSTSSSLTTMALDQEQLLQSYTSSVSFLHSVAKQAIPNFRSQGHEHKNPALLLVTSPLDTSPVSALSSAACRTLMTLLVDANAGRNITIDYAENIFVPEPELPPRAEGRGKRHSLNVAKKMDRSSYQSSEDPTELWAIYNQLGAAD